MIALLALIVLGPEKLPKLAAKVGHWTGRARAMARNLRMQLEQEVSYEELLKQKQAAEEALRKAQEAPMNFHADVQATAQTVQADMNNILNPAASPAHSSATTEPPAPAAPTETHTAPSAVPVSTSTDTAPAIRPNS